MAVPSIIESIKEFLSKRGNEGQTKSTDFYKLTAMVSDSLVTLSDALQSPAFANDLASVLYTHDRGTHTFLTTAAYDFIRSKLSHADVRKDDHEPLYIFKTVTEIVIDDLKDIMAHYKHYFPDNVITDEDLKMSNLIISGYVKNAYQYSRFLSFMFFARDHFLKNGVQIQTQRHTGPAKYIATRIQESLPIATHLIAEVLSRGTQSKFLNRLNKISSSHRDVKLKTDGIDITMYAEDGNYDQVELDYTQMGLINPLLFVGKWYGAWQHDNYERDKDTRDWIQMRIAYLEQKKAGMDPNGPEAMKIEDILKKYLDKISHLDAKIERYEIQY